VALLSRFSLTDPSFERAVCYCEVKTRPSAGSRRGLSRFALRRAPAEYDDVFMERMASAYLEGTAWSDLRLRTIAELLEPLAGDRVVDLGCAAGAVTDFLSQRGCRVVGVDAEPRAIAKARSLFPAHEFVLADVRALPFEPCSFDKAVAADLVEHLDDATFGAMLAELRRVLVPGGTFTLYTPNPRHVFERLKAHDLILAQNPTHIGLRDARTLGRMLREGGFVVERSEWRPSFFRGLRTVERYGGRRLELLRYRLCIRARSEFVAQSH
jgi:SAM-dependent methyltransferase